MGSAFSLSNHHLIQYTILPTILLRAAGKQRVDGYDDWTKWWTEIEDIKPETGHEAGDGTERAGRKRIKGGWGSSHPKISQRPMKSQTSGTYHPPNYPRVFQAGREGCLRRFGGGSKFSHRLEHYLRTLRRGGAGPITKGMPRMLHCCFPLGCGADVD